MKAAAIYIFLGYIEVTRGCTEDAQLKCTEDAQLKCTEDAQMKCTEDAQIKCTEDAQLKWINVSKQEDETSACSTLCGSKD